MPRQGLMAFARLAGGGQELSVKLGWPGVS
jgi:hypothetical protein